MSALFIYVFFISFQLGSAMRSMRTNLDNYFNASEDAGPHKCGEKLMESVCNCDKWSSLKRHYQCSGCKDKFKWGYGCELDCDPSCGNGCDFSGNCIVPNTCKHTRRIPEKEQKEGVVNDHGECQACRRGYYGPLCMEQCPKNCKPSYEGGCTRIGQCYKCHEGWFGEDCNQKCPTSCPKCAMLDNLVPNPRKPKSFFSAGECPEQCSTHMHGQNCELDCPKNCDKSETPSCSKDTGLCYKCDGNKFYGDSCDVPCPENCLDGTCNKDTGMCKKGCKLGFWGDHCNKKCSVHCSTENKWGNKKATKNICRRGTGKCTFGCTDNVWGKRCTKKCPVFTEKQCHRYKGIPSACTHGMYPSLLAPTTEYAARGFCKKCADNCLGGGCNVDGRCSKGCEVGFFGPTCSEICPAHCKGPCDTLITGLPDGQCFECETGYRGKLCNEHCHKSCKTCEQYESAKPNTCRSCDDNEAAVLEGKVCKCIEHATRPNDGDKCMCKPPINSPDKQAYFVQKPTKVCRIACSKGFRQVYNGSLTICMSNQRYKSVLIADLDGDGFHQEWCPDGSVLIPDESKLTDGECLEKNIVDNIVGM